MRVDFIPRFYLGEDDAVLVALDGDEAERLAGAMRQASTPSGSPLILRFGQQLHALVTEEGGGVIELSNGGVTWHLSRELMEEMARKLEAMVASQGPCHHYVDIKKPASTLILSRDEYPDPFMSSAP